MHIIKIFTDLSKYDRSEKQGILKIKKGCNFSYNFCSIGECVICDDCLISFTFGDKKIEDSEFSTSTLDEIVYEIDFFDDFNFEDFSNYMSSDSSDYRAFDVKNGIIVRPNHSDLEKIAQFQNDDYIERFNSFEEVIQTQENITCFQKIIRKFKGIK